MLKWTQLRYARCVVSMITTTVQELRAKKRKATMTVTYDKAALGSKGTDVLPDGQVSSSSMMLKDGVGYGRMG